MTEQATVHSIHGDTVTLVCNDNEKCASCKSGFCSVKKGRRMTARNTSHIPLKEGDLVDVYIPAGKAVFAGFMVLIVPLILFIGMYLGVEKAFPGITEGLKVLSGFGGLVLGFLISWIRTVITGKNEMPEIRTAVSGPDSSPDDYTALREFQS